MEKEYGRPPEKSERELFLDRLATYRETDEEKPDQILHGTGTPDSKYKKNWWTKVLGSFWEARDFGLLSEPVASNVTVFCDTYKNLFTQTTDSKDGISGHPRDFLTDALHIEAVDEMIDKVIEDLER